MPSVKARPRPETWTERRSIIRHRVSKPFYWLEWYWEWVAFALSNWVFLEVLEYAGRLSVLVAVIFYVVEWPDRQKQKHYQAWQVINTAQGKGGSGGRIEALHELNEDRVPLVGVNVSGAALMGVRLEKADLHRSTFEGADLRNCNLRSANLEYADLSQANLRGGDLRKANLANADLSDADVNGADFSSADLSGTNLGNADLRNCDLRYIKWKDIASFKQANIYRVKNPPPGFVEFAMKNGAVSMESDEAWLKMITKP
jgi:hypothetical protein